MNGSKLLLLLLTTAVGAASAFVIPSHDALRWFKSTTAIFADGPSELPDSLEDSADRATKACLEFSNTEKMCRVEFDTSAGDETYTRLKASTPFMKSFVAKLSRTMIPEVVAFEKEAADRVNDARSQLQSMGVSGDEDKIKELQTVLANNGYVSKWKGPIARIYFPDAGSTALAERDWPSADLPPCVEYTSLRRLQTHDVSKDALVFFFAFQAPESEAIEKVMERNEDTPARDLKLTVFVNPEFIDMGVTGYGYAGRVLKDRLIDKLQYTYYLKSLSWGAVTRTWPQDFSVWQDDDTSPEGYRMLTSMETCPSNPDVIDIYNKENEIKSSATKGIFNSVGGFMRGMMNL